MHARARSDRSTSPATYANEEIVATSAHAISQPNPEGRIIRLTPIVWALVAIMPVTLAVTGIACSCGSKPSPKEALRRATIVFSGRVTMERVVKRRLGNTSEEHEMREFLFEASDIWKGAVPKRVLILTGMGDADCGYSFEIGERYLVYAYGDGTQFGTNICTRTNYEAAADEDIRQLGTPTKQQ